MLHRTSLLNPPQTPHINTVVAQRAVARSLRPTTTSLSSRVKLNYDLEQSVGDFFGVLGDGRQLGSVSEHARMHAHVCSC